MTLTRRPSPFSELVTLRQAVDRLFDDTVFRPLTAYPGNGDLARLPLDIRTTSDSLLAEAALPGVLLLRIPRAEQVKPRQIQIQIRPGTAGETPAIETDSAAGTADPDVPDA